MYFNPNTQFQEVEEFQGPDQSNVILFVILFVDIPGFNINTPLFHNLLHTTTRPTIVPMECIPQDQHVPNCSLALISSTSTS